MKSVKGRLYCPKDNSYIKNLSNGIKGLLCNKKSVDTGFAYCVLWRESWLIDEPEKIEEYTIEEIAKMLGKDPKSIRIKM